MGYSDSIVMYDLSGSEQYKGQINNPKKLRLQSLMGLRYKLFLKSLIILSFSKNLIFGLNIVRFSKQKPSSFKLINDTCIPSSGEFSSACFSVQSASCFEVRF